MSNQGKKIKKIALITGANKGIGFEIARKLGQKGITIYLGARNIEAGKIAISELCQYGIECHLIKLDLDDKETILTAAETIKKEQGVLDILVNNAGLIDPMDGIPSTTNVAVVRRTFETNFFSALEVCQAMLPLLYQSASASIVNVSSGLGSLQLNQNSNWEFFSTKLIGYNASKAALNMLTIQLAWELKNTNIKVNSVNPGYTNTDLVPGTINGQPVEIGAQAAVNLSLIDKNGPSGGFFDIDGIVPW